MIIHLLPKINAKNAGAESKKKVKGKGSGRHHNNAKIPAETILEMRRMYELQGKAPRVIQAAFPHLGIEYVRQVLNYTIRGNLRVR